VKVLTSSRTTAWGLPGAFMRRVIWPWVVIGLKAGTGISHSVGCGCGLPPEFSRAERWDAVYFLDLPTAPEKDLIWVQYRRLYGTPEAQARPDDTSWTGAEIKSCCRLAALLDVTLTQAAHHVVPVAVTAAEQVERLRSWASGRCLSASAPGVYRRDGEPAARPGRRVQRGGSDN
jgi:hypothetical protein